MATRTNGAITLSFVNVSEHVGYAPTPYSWWKSILLRGLPSMEHSTENIRCETNINCFMYFLSSL